MNKKKGLVIGLSALVVMSALFTNAPAVEESRNTSTSLVNQLLGTHATTEESVIEKGSEERRILVIPIEGTIGGDDGYYDHDLILEAIDSIKLDPTIKAVLLSIDSPGGAVYETREVYDRMKAALAEVDVPVYASMGSVAASGGYYLSMLGEKVYASSETVTGSIGVIMSSYETSELLGKLGVKPIVIKSAAMKDIMSMTREMTAEEKEVLQTYVDESYQAFVEVVAEGRDMSETEVKKLADGRVYSGRQAQKNGLVDELGYEADALSALREAYDLADAQVFEYTSTATGFDSFLPSFLGQLGLGQSSQASELNKAIEKLESLDDMKLEYRLQGRRR